MRIYPIIVLCLITITAPLAQTVNIHSNPSGLAVWREGEYLGNTPLELNGPFDEALIFTVVEGTRLVTARIDLPIADDVTCYVSMKEKPPVSVGTVILGALAGAAAAFLLSIVVDSIAH